MIRFGRLWRSLRAPQTNKPSTAGRIAHMAQVLSNSEGESARPSGAEPDIAILAQALA